MRKGNVYSVVPDRLPDEIIETLVNSEKVRIERIVSDSHSSPEGFWYDQDENEWVMVMKGRAGMRFKGEDETIVLEAGDWIDIPARVKHRVEWTDPGCKTVWLAIFYV